jgi:hypothetical protein
MIYHTHAETKYPNQLVFSDADDNNCQIVCDEQTISLLTSTNVGCVELTENQAKDLVTILNFWIKNKKLCAGNIKFGLNPPPSPI